MPESVIVADDGDLYHNVRFLQRSNLVEEVDQLLWEGLNKAAPELIADAMELVAVTDELREIAALRKQKA